MLVEKAFLKNGFSSRKGHDPKDAPLEFSIFDMIGLLLLWSVGRAQAEASTRGPMGTRLNDFAVTVYLFLQ